MRNFGSYPIPTHDQIEYEDDDSPEEEEEEEEENPNQNFTQQNGYFYNDDNSKRHPKKRKLESFVSNNRRDMWSEEDSFVLLETWGEKYLEFGRRSLRADDWSEVTEKVNDMSGVERTQVECRNQLDVMKKKYTKERVKVESGHGTNWAFYKNMDVLLNVRVRGVSGLGCGIDSGEYVFMNPQVYLERSNVLDEMRDSPVESDMDDMGEEEDLGRGEGDGDSARLLAESIQRFGEVYEKIEENKRKHMMDLERMRQDFQRELEVQKKQIVDRAQAEIVKIREMDHVDDDGDNTDTSVDNLGD